MAASQRSRYSYQDIVERIRAEIDYRQLPHSHVYRALGISKDQWSRKMRPNETGTGGRGASFTLDELGRIADLLHGPPGWPVVSEESLEEYIRDLDSYRLHRIRG